MRHSQPLTCFTLEPNRRQPSGQLCCVQRRKKGGFLKKMKRGWENVSVDRRTSLGIPRVPCDASGSPIDKRERRNVCPKKWTRSISTHQKVPPEHAYQDEVLKELYYPSHDCGSRPDKQATRKYPNVLKAKAREPWLNIPTKD